MVEELDAALRHFAEIVERDLGVDVLDLPGGGAAGGLGAGLVAFLGADMVRGAPLIVDAAGLDHALTGASVVFTAEGAVDIQTTFGKGPVEVAHRARDAKVDAVLLAGSLGRGWEAVLEQGVVAVVPIAEGPATLDDMQKDTAGLVERATARACRLMSVAIQ
jgi:glycerate kinase